MLDNLVCIEWCKQRIATALNEGNESDVENYTQLLKIWENI